MKLQSLIGSLSNGTDGYVNSVLASVSDFQCLIDMLAKETEKYTKACVAKIPDQISLHKSMIDALIAEIYRREKKSKPHKLGDRFPTNNRSLTDY